MTRRIPESELVLNDDGTVYHIALREDQIHDTVLLVGDPGRVELITNMMDKVHDEVHNREFFTRCASYNGMKMTVMSTGIGTDNIDIAVNELDAAVNIDTNERIEKLEKRKLNLIRLGTSGSLQEDIEVDTAIASEYGLGFDGLMNYYQTKFKDEEISIRDAFMYDTAYPMELAKPYVIESDFDLRLRIAPGMKHGITATASGFYAPQGRELRLKTRFPELNTSLTSFSFKDHRIANYEMETAALYGLGRALGHSCCTVCAIIANRLRKEYSKDYKKTVKTMVGEVLERLTSH